MTNVESTPKRARRMAREWTDKWFTQWSAAKLKWIRFAFCKGYEAACVDQAAEATVIDDAIAQWEKDSDAEALVTILDAWLERIEQRVAA